MDNRYLSSPDASSNGTLLSVRDLKVHFDMGGGTLWDRMTGGNPLPQVVKAVDGKSHKGPRQDRPGQAKTSLSPAV